MIVGLIHLAVSTSNLIYKALESVSQRYLDVNTR
jgi:hypothetical protein